MHGDTRSPLYPPSYWQKLTPPLINSTSRVSDETTTIYDIIIVGAGLTGTSAALHFAKMARSSLLLDSRRVAGGATGRNGGHLHPRAGPSPRAVWEREIGAKCLKDFMAKEGGDYGLRCGGSCMLLGPDESKMELKEGLEKWDAEETSKHLGMSESSTLKFSGALYDPNGCNVQPAEIVSTIAKAAMKTGNVEFRHSINVVEVRPPSDNGDGVITVKTTDGVTFKARNVIVSTNGLLGTILKPLSKVCLPRRNQVLVTSPIPPRFLAAFTCYSGADEIYAHQRDDGRLVVGGARSSARADDSWKDDDPLDENVSKALREFVFSLGGECETCEIEGEWAGTLGFTADGNPLVGMLWGDQHSTAGQIAVAGCYCGHGMPTAFAAGKCIAELIVGGELKVEDKFLLQDEFRLDRFGMEEW